MGEYAKALPLYQQAIAIRKKSLGKAHPSYASSLNNLAYLYGTIGKNKKALSLFLQAQKITNQQIANVFTIMSERQRLQFSEQQKGNYWATLSLVHRKFTDQQALRSALALVIARKGVVFDAQARQQEAIAQSLDGDTAKLWVELNQQRGILAHLLQNKPAKMPSKTYKRKIKALYNSVETLETQLAGKSALVAEQLRQRNVTSTQLAKALPRGAVLAEFVRIRDRDWKKDKWKTTSRYLAFVLNRKGTVQLIDLGDADTLDTQVQTALNMLGDVKQKSGKQLTASDTLYRLL